MMITLLPSQYLFGNSSPLSQPPQPVTEDDYGTKKPRKQTRYIKSQGSNKKALRVAGHIRSNCRSSIAGTFRLLRDVRVSWPKEVDEITMMTILKLQCLTCDYNSMQDTKRDPKGAMLDICREIHENTYRSHMMEISDLSREELEFLVLSKHPRFRQGYHHQRESSSRSAIFDIMHDLAKMERSELENLWREYGTK